MRLALSGLGMISPIGRTVEGACAAHRAGISRVSPLAGTGAGGDSDLGEGLKAHTLRGYADGFVQFGFWLRVGIGCFEDLLRYSRFPSEAAFWRRTWIAAAIPVMDEERFFLPADDVEDMYRSNVLVPLVSELGLPVPAEHLVVLEEGKCGAAHALELAAQLIERNEADRVVVLAVDSYCDPFSLAWLAGRDLLKTAEKPMGLIPGEAGAAFAVERPEAATRVDAIVSAAAIDDSQEYDELPVDRIGRALAGAMRSALGRTSPPFRGDLYLDLNGLEWRARAWGHAQVGLHGAIDFERTRQIVPATSFGETGCASAALAVCLAARSFARHHASSADALVCSVDDFGDVAAIHLERPER